MKFLKKLFYNLYNVENLSLTPFIVISLASLLFNINTFKTHKGEV